MTQTLEPPRVKPDLPDGYQMVPAIRDLASSCARWGKMFPCLLAARYTMYMNSWRSPAQSRQLFSSDLRTAARHPAATQAEPVDAMFFYSTRKPAWQPAIDRLAERLSKSGYKVALISRDSTELNVPAGVFRSIAQVLFSFLAAVTLMFDLAIRGSGNFKLLAKNFWNVWLECYASTRRFDAASKLLALLKPRLVLTNGDHLPFASEIVLSKAARSAAKVWLFNEYPDSDMWPVVSDEVWVWNERSVRTFVERGGFDERRFRVMGKVELDFLREAAAGAPGEAEKQLVARCAGRPAVVILSEHTGIPTLAMEAGAAEAMRWIAEAAAAKPDWNFIYKHRSASGDAQIPGIERVQGLSNVIVADPGITLARMLAWDFAKAFAATCSSGLYVAASLGKAAIRLRVSSRAASLPVLDAVARAADSPDDLTRALDELKNPDFDFGAEYPCPGRSLDRMEARCLEMLEGPHPSSMPELPPQNARRGARTDEDYRAEIRLVKEWSVKLGRMRPDGAILDVGCGDGRLAYAMSEYLNENGRYTAFDVNQPFIESLREGFRHDRRFRFDRLDVKHSYYNPAGAFDVRTSRFPYVDAAFDVVFVKSVFTHLLPGDISSYLKEMTRVLKIGGTLWATFFLVNAEAAELDQAGKSAVGLRQGGARVLNHKLPDAWVRDVDVPERVVGVDEVWLERELAAAGFKTLRIVQGTWCGRPSGIHEQDILIAEKIR